MLRLCLLILFGTLSYSIVAYDLLTQTHGEVWPKPQQQTKSDQVIPISNEFRIAYNGDYCEILEKSIQRHYPWIIGLPDRNSETAAESVLKTLQINVSKGCTEDYPTSSMNESYTLDVKVGTSFLKSEEVWGALRGIETFTQLVYNSRETLQKVVNKTSIVDFPRFNFRGFLIDTSRHYLSVNTIKKHIDAMEATKYNVLHWHIVDDPSFPFQSQVYPDLSREGAFNPYTHIYTYTDVIDVLNYSRLRGIRVIPEFDTPGHTNSWGVAYPYLLSECIDSDGTSSFTGPLEPRFNSTYQFVQDLFTEVNELFPDEILFLGGDEVSYSCWESNPVYQQFIEDSGLSGYSGLESYYIQKLLKLVDGLPNKRTSIVWQEVFDNGLSISSDTVVNVWKSGNYETELATVTNSSYRVVLSAPWYLNYISYGEDWVAYYKVEPLDFATTQAQKDLFFGCEACMWGEYVDDTNMLSRTWPRAAAVSERAWSSESTTDVPDAEKRMSELRCRLIQRGIPAEPFDPGFCQFEWDASQYSEQKTPNVVKPQKLEVL